MFYDVFFHDHVYNDLLHELTDFFMGRVALSFGVTLMMVISIPMNNNESVLIQIPYPELDNLKS